MVSRIGPRLTSPQPVSHTPVFAFVQKNTGPRCNARIQTAILSTDAASNASSSSNEVSL